MRDYHINDKEIESLVNSEAGGTKKYKWDRTVKGFGVYKTAKGVATFVYRYRVGTAFRFSAS